MDAIDLTLPDFLRAENRDQPPKARTRQADTTRVTRPTRTGEKSKRQRAKELAKTGVSNNR